MPRNSGGIYSLPPVYLATPGETIMTEQHNAPLEDIANGITESLPRSGVAPMTGDLKMGGQKITGLGAPVADTDAARKVDINIPAASETVAGKVELATAAETITGTDTTRAVHPAGSKAAIDDAISDLGLNAGATMPVADQAAAEAGTGNGSLMTPLRTRQALNATGTAPTYACRAWVNFNGTGTVAIRASGNVSSITDNGVGDYTINFATAMPDVNYSVSGAIHGSTSGGATYVFSMASIANPQLMGSVQVRSTDGGASSRDAIALCIAIFR